MELQIQIQIGNIFLEQDHYSQKVTQLQKKHKQLSTKMKVSYQRLHILFMSTVRQYSSNKSNEYDMI